MVFRVGEVSLQLHKEVELKGERKGGGSISIFGHLFSLMLYYELYLDFV